MANKISDGFSHSPWIQCDLGVWEPVTRNSTPLLYKKNVVIYEQQHQSDHIYIIKSGRVRVATYDPSGAEKHIYFAMEGCAISEASMFLGIPDNTSATAIVDCLLYKIPSKVIEKAMADSQKFALEVVKMLSRKVIMLTEQIAELSFRQSLSRVSQSLVDLVQQYGIKTPDGIKIGIKFTHEELAHLVNTSRVTVSNIFNDLAEEGVVTRIDGYFVVKDLESLMNFADRESEIK